MPTFLDDLEDHVQEKSTAVFRATFRDEEDVQIQASDITDLKWTLTDADGNVINSKENVDIPSPENPQDILLSGNDLQILTGESGNVLRVLTALATYNSTNGSGLLLKDEVKFWVDNLVAVT